MEEKNMEDLRVRARELGIRDYLKHRKPQLLELVAAAEARLRAPKPDIPGPRDPADFSDLALEVKSAPDEPPRDVEDPKVAPSAKPSPPTKPTPTLPALTMEAIAMAINAGDHHGLPAAGQRATLKDGTVVLNVETSRITASIAGHAVECEIETVRRISSFKTRGRGESLSGKYRLLSDISIALGGQMVRLKAGKEFYSHQIDVEAVKRAGGVVIQLG